MAMTRMEHKRTKHVWDTRNSLEQTSDQICQNSIDSDHHADQGHKGDLHIQGRHGVEMDAEQGLPSDTVRMGRCDIALLPSSTEGIVRPVPLNSKDG